MKENKEKNVVKGTIDPSVSVLFCPIIFKCKRASSASQFNDDFVTSNSVPHHDVNVSTKQKPAPRLLAPPSKRANTANCH